MSKLSIVCISLLVTACGQSGGQSASSAAPGVVAPPVAPVTKVLTFLRGTAYSCYVRANEVDCWTGDNVVHAYVQTSLYSIDHVELRGTDLCFDTRTNGAVVNPGTATWCMGNGTWDATQLSVHPYSYGSGTPPLDPSITLTGVPSLYVGTPLPVAEAAWLDAPQVSEQVTCVQVGAEYVCPEVSLPVAP